MQTSMKSIRRRSKRDRDLPNTNRLGRVKEKAQRGLMRSAIEIEGEERRDQIEKENLKVPVIETKA